MSTAQQATGVLGLPLTSLSPASLLGGALTDSGGQIPRLSRPTRARSIAPRPSRTPSVWIDRLVWARKRRTPAGVEHLGLVGTPGRRAVVVDDILDTGDTLVSCCRQLREAGVRRIGVIATHGLFTGDRWRVLLADGVPEIWITDSVLSRRRPPQAQVVGGRAAAGGGARNKLSLRRY